MPLLIISAISITYLLFPDIHLFLHDKQFKRKYKATRKFCMQLQLLLKTLNFIKIHLTFQNYHLSSFFTNFNHSLKQEQNL